MDQHAHDLCTLLDALRLTRVVLVGMSMGGYIAFAFYRAFPDRVRALVLADTRAEADTPEGRQAREDSARAAEAEGTAAQTEKLLPRLLSPFTLHHRPTIVARVQTMIAGTSPQGFAGAQRGMALRPDATPLLSTIACPTLILVGEDDVITPPAVAQTMHRRIAGSHLVIIPKAGHLAPMENPRAFNVALVEFLHAIRRGH
jgi:pimeloyl-ACP methyl ester carboxylesterase